MSHECRDMWPHSKTENAAPAGAQSETIVRWAIILRDSKGRGELLGQIHRTEAAARESGRYWQSVSPCGEQAEVVTFSVLVSGTPIQSARDLFTSEGEHHAG